MYESMCGTEKTAAQKIASHTAQLKPEATSFHSFWPTSTLSCPGDQLAGPIFMVIFLSIVAAYRSCNPENGAVSTA